MGKQAASSPWTNECHRRCQQCAWFGGSCVKTAWYLKDTNRRASFCSILENRRAWHLPCRNLGSLLNTAALGLYDPSNKSAVRKLRKNQRNKATTTRSVSWRLWPWKSHSFAFIVPNTKRANIVQQLQIWQMKFATTVQQVSMMSAKGTKIYFDETVHKIINSVTLLKTIQSGNWMVSTRSSGPRVQFSFWWMKRIPLSRQRDSTCDWQRKDHFHTSESNSMFLPVYLLNLQLNYSACNIIASTDIHQLPDVETWKSRRHCRRSPSIWSIKVDASVRDTNQSPITQNACTAK